MRPLVLYLIIILVPALSGCARIAPDKESATGDITAAAPYFLKSILAPALEQFKSENKLTVGIDYFPVDSLLMYALERQSHDLIIGPDFGIYDHRYRDSLIPRRRWNCPASLNLIMVGRTDSKPVKGISDLADTGFGRIVTVDPAHDFEGILADMAISRSRFKRYLFAKRIAAGDAAHALTFLRSGEADAAILLESSLPRQHTLHILAEVNTSLEAYLSVCLTLTPFCNDTASAQAFIDLFDSRIGAFYTQDGVYFLEQ